jgi:hypothetical protein
MPKVTAMCGEVFFLNLRGEPVQGQVRPCLPDDDGLTLKFHNWLREENLWPIRLMLSGPGMFDAIFYVEDEEKIVKWLEENGVIINPEPPEREENQE